MGSVSAAHLIMFIGSLVIATAVAGTVVVEIGQVSDSIEDRGASITNEIETDVAIISDETQPDAIVGEDENGEPENITILAKNIGSQDVPADGSSIDTLVDGSYVSVGNVSHAAYGDATLWETGGVVEIEIPLEDQTISGDTDVTIIVSGNEDTMTFYYNGED